MIRTINDYSKKTQYVEYGKYKSDITELTNAARDKIKELEIKNEELKCLVELYDGELRKTKPDKDLLSKLEQKIDRLEKENKKIKQVKVVSSTNLSTSFANGFLATLSEKEREAVLRSARERAKAMFDAR